MLALALPCSPKVVLNFRSPVPHPQDWDYRCSYHIWFMWCCGYVGMEPLRVPRLLSKHSTVDTIPPTPWCLFQVKKAMCMEWCWPFYTSERETTTFGSVRLPAELVSCSCCHPQDKRQICSSLLSAPVPIL